MIEAFFTAYWAEMIALAPAAGRLFAYLTCMFCFFAVLAAVLGVLMGRSDER